MISSAQILINEQNALVGKKRKKNMGTQVQILRESKYGDENGNARPCAVGDVLTTTYNYAKVLVEAGSATFELPVVEAAPIEEEVIEEGTTLFTDVAGVSKTVAAALLAAGATWEKINEMPQASLTKVPGLGAKTAAKLKAQAALEVERDETRD